MSTVSIVYIGFVLVGILYGGLDVGITHAIASLRSVSYCLDVWNSTPYRPMALSIISSACDETATAILAVYVITLLYDSSIYAGIGYEKYVPMVYCALFQLASIVFK
jgi:hypothetical protein